MILLDRCVFYQVHRVNFYPLLGKYTKARHTMEEVASSWPAHFQQCDPCTLAPLNRSIFIYEVRVTTALTSQGRHPVKVDDEQESSF